MNQGPFGGHHLHWDLCPPTMKVKGLVRWARDEKWNAPYKPSAVVSLKGTGSIGSFNHIPHFSHQPCSGASVGFIASFRCESLQGCEAPGEPHLPKEASPACDDRWLWVKSQWDRSHFGGFRCTTHFGTYFSGDWDVH